MPLIDMPTPGLLDNVGIAPPKTPDETAAAEESPDALATIAAAARQNNIVVSGMSNVEERMSTDAGTGPYMDPNWDTWKNIQGTKYEDHWQSFTGIFNKQDFAARAAQIDMEDQDRATLAQGGWGAALASVAAGIADPTVLIPVAGQVNKARTAGNVIRSAALVGASAAGATAVQEVGLHASQQTRTLEESAWSVGSSALLGGFLGGAIGLLTPAERAASEAALDQVRGIGPAKPVGAGADVVQTATRDELTVSGRAGGAVANATSFLTPTQRLNVSPSASARQFGQQLVENTMYQRLHDEGGSLGAAAETNMRVAMNGRMASGVEAMGQVWSDARKAGLQMSRADFDNAVGRAMRRGDTGENEFVTRAAQAWREKVFDPFKDEAIKLGLLPENVSTDTAQSYLRRIWDVGRLTGDETRFRQIAQEWVTNSLHGQYKADLASMSDEVSELWRARSVGKMTAEEMEAAAAKLRRAHADKWEIERLVEAMPGKAPDFSEYAKEVTDSIYAKLTGRAVDNNLPDDIVPVTRGPLKERTFSIPDELVEDFLVSDVNHVAHEYSRKMAGEIELTRKFGRADMRDQFKAIEDEYAGLRDAVGAAKSVEEIRGVIGKDGSFMDRIKTPDLEAVRREAWKFLKSRQDRDQNDLAAMRDLLRGTHNYQRMMTTVGGRWTRGILGFNFLRLMGGVAIANISEIFRAGMVHGVGAFMSEGVGPLLTSAGRAARGLSKQEAKLAGQVVEHVMQDRLQTLAEIGDPYAMGSPLERWIKNATNVGSRYTGLSLLTDMNKSVTATLTQNRMLRALQGGEDDRYLSYLGMDANMRSRVAAQAKQFATKDHGIHIANTERWTDAEAVRAYRAAMSKDIDSTIVTRSVGDVPLFANTPIGRLILQFRSFAIASHQRVLIRGLQEAPSRFVGGLVAMTALGMFQKWLGAYASGDDIHKRFWENAQNRGWWIGEGLDSTGILSMPFEFGNTMEKLTGINPVSDPLREAGVALGAPVKGSSQRFASRGIVGATLGPTFGGGIDDLGTVLRALTAKAGGEEMTDTQSQQATKAAMNLTPFYRHAVVRQVLDMLTGQRAGALH